MKAPKIDPKILEYSRKFSQAQETARRKHALWEWIKDKVVDIIAVIISLIALIRTF